MRVAHYSMYMYIICPDAKTNFQSFFIIFICCMLTSKIIFFSSFFFLIDCNLIYKFESDMPCCVPGCHHLYMHQPCSVYEFMLLNNSVKGIFNVNVDGDILL